MPALSEPSAYQRREGFLPPGSDAARAKGCWCAVFDNNRGRFPPFPPTDEMPDGGWWITEGCPVHSPSVTVVPEP